MPHNSWLAGVIFVCALFWALGLAFAVMVGISRPYIHGSARLCRRVIGACIRPIRKGVGALLRHGVAWLACRVRNW